LIENAYNYVSKPVNIHTTQWNTARSELVDFLIHKDELL